MLGINTQPPSPLPGVDYFSSTKKNLENREKLPLKIYKTLMMKKMKILVEREQRDFDPNFAYFSAFFGEIRVRDASKKNNRSYFVFSRQGVRGWAAKSKSSLKPRKRALILG